MTGDEHRPNGGGYQRDLRVGADVIFWGRVIMVAFLGGYLMWTDVGHPGLLAAVLGATIGLHVAWGWWYLWRGHRITPMVATISLGFDAVFAGVAVLFTGGTDSQAMFIWAPIVAMGGIWIGARGVIPVIVIIIGFLIAASGVDPGPKLTVDQSQKAVFAGFMLIFVAIQGWIAAANQRLALARLIEAEERAHRDPLTGIPNRTAFQAEMTAIAADAVASSLVMIDLDDFKRINDTRGHQQGDRVLTDFAERLSGHLPRLGFVARLGGEEFVCVLRGMDEPAALDWIDSVRRQSSEADGTDDERVTFSAGISQFEGGEDGPHVAMERADQALYAAKRRGKNCTVTSDQIRGAERDGVVSAPQEAGRLGLFHVDDERPDQRGG